MVKKGILLVNLGTPDEPTPKAIYAYLKPFLSDNRVINRQNLFWKIILYGIILNIRPKKVAKLYQKIWGIYNKSPLLYHTELQRIKLQSFLGDPFDVQIAMRYGKPSIDEAIEYFEKKQISEITILPLYPQNSATTVASVFDQLSFVLANKRNLPSIHFISGYHKNPLYINALVESIQQFWDKNGKADYLIFSYHGLPKEYCQKGDPYQKACIETTKAVVERLNLQENQYTMAFQSRVGVAEWLKPYFDETLIQLANKGIQSIQVISPAFASDCLETLEEINIQGRQLFLSSGGVSFDYIPCLNDSNAHIQLMADLVKN